MYNLLRFLLLNPKEAIKSVPSRHAFSNTPVKCAMFPTDEQRPVAGGFIPVACMKSFWRKARALISKVSTMSWFLCKHQASPLSIENRY